jgi:hypothetical protein
MSDQEIQDKEPAAPRVTLADIETNIASEHYFTGDVAAARGVSLGNVEALSRTSWDALELLTFCVLVLKNGFIVTGESACVSPENFDAEKCRQYAREKAIDKAWTLMGYELRSKLACSQAATT